MVRLYRKIQNERDEFRETLTVSWQMVCRAN